MRRNWSDEDLLLAFRSSRSLREIIIKLGLIPAGGNYLTVKRRAAEAGLDITAIPDQAWSKGLSLPANRLKPLTDLLKDGVCCNTHKLKLRLIKEKYFQRKCYSCGRTIWQESKIPLELEHIDGNRLNNKIENLTLLCPNCHALTATYRGRNIRCRADVV